MRASWFSPLYVNVADHTALSSFTSEASLIAGTNLQPTLLAGFFADTEAYGRCVRFEAEGILGSTGTPTYTFQCRLGTTQGSSDLTGTSVGVSAAITTGSGVSNQNWRLVLDLICNTPGQGSTNTTLNCSGFVESGGGFAAPYNYALSPSTPPTATWTATINAASTQYFNLSVTCSASSASNAIRCKKLKAYVLN